MNEAAAQGALTETVFYILISMLEPRHGYAVMQHVEKLTKGRVRFGAGTLYGAITTLLEKEWICYAGDDMGSRKKEYVVTSLGRTVLRVELARLKELLEHGKNELGDDT